MPFYDSHSRTDLRAVYLDAWRKHKDSRPLEPVEAQIVTVLVEHPEYHPFLEVREQALMFDAPAGTTNPFMHMGLHLALRDQVAVDRPAGIRAAYERLCVRRGRHAAEHAICEQLAESFWNAQRSGLPPDEKIYLRRVQKMVR